MKSLWHVLTILMIHTLFMTIIRHTTILILLSITLLTTMYNARIMELLLEPQATVDVCVNLVLAGEDVKLLTYVLQVHNGKSAKTEDIQLAELETVHVNAHKDMKDYIVRLPLLSVQ